MKRIPALAAILLTLTFAPLAADEAAEIYRLIYIQSDGLSQKHAAIQSMVGLKDNGTAPILAEALDELLKNQGNYRVSTDKDLYARIVRLIAGALGDYKYDLAAGSLWEVVQQVEDPLAQAEAIMALGRMRALDYAERIALMLRNLNLAPVADKDAGEKRAYACVIALEKLKDARGFSPVFYATEAWYGQRVRQQAERSLPAIVADPIDPIKTLLVEETLPRKLKALKAAAASSAPASRKIEAAVLALEIGHRQAARDKAETLELATIRKLALRTLIANKARGAAPVEGCRASYERGYDEEERLLALSALGINGDDPAAQALRDILFALNKDQLNGVSDEVRNRMAKAAAENAGLTRNPLLRIALQAMASNDKWSGGIMLAAQNALKALP